MTATLNCLEKTHVNVGHFTRKFSPRKYTDIQF